MKKKRKWLRYVVTLSIALLIGLAVLLARDAFHQTDAHLLLQALCDAFFVPGILILCVGFLVVVANDGLFDMINYGVGKTLRLVLSEKRRSAYPKTFYDYRVMKHEGKNPSAAFLFFIGGGLVLVAVVFLLFSEGIL